MQKRIWRLLLVVILAWNFGAVLVDEVSMWLPTTLSFAAFLVPTNLLGQGIIFYFKFAIALVLFALLLKALTVLFGFASPKTQRYAATIFLRRIQGVWAETAIILFYFFLLPFVFLTISGWPAPEGPPPAWYEQYLSRAKEFLGFSYSSYTDRASIYVDTVKAYWPALLGGALLLWGLTTKLIKRFIVSIHNSVLLGFIEVGRFGQGGSARFAGLIEEWSLRYDK
jgi:hypothetical protein